MTAHHIVETLTRNEKRHKRNVDSMINYIQTSMSQKFGAEFKVIGTEPLPDKKLFLGILNLKRTCIKYKLVE